MDGYLDKKGLKLIKGPQGHEAGDRAIANFQALVRKHAGTECVYRDGGDEFVVLFGAVEQSAVLTRVRDLLVALGNQGLSASVGVVGCDDPLEPPQAFKERADQAMYRAKQESKKHTRPSALAVADDPAEIIPVSSPE